MASHLHAAKKAKDDEFYTQYSDIEKEMNEYYEYDKDVFRNKIVLLPCDDPEWSNFTKYFVANFNRLGLKKLISTSYASATKANKYEAPIEEYHQVTLFELNSENYGADKTDSHGKIFTLTRKDDFSKVDIDDLKWDYLEGDGDFRSEEITKLRDEADIIITNEPFSLFIEFINWVMEGNKKFSIIANQNVYTDKDAFPLLEAGKIWVGAHSGDMAFMVPKNSQPRETRYWEDKNGQKWRSMGNATWITNIEHGVRHERLSLMTQKDNLKYNKKLVKKFNEYGIPPYSQYDNYDAIEVPFVDAIPSDYKGIMGVPVTFLNKFNPDQFELLGCTQRGCHNLVPDFKKYDEYIEMKQDGTATKSKGSKTNENANLAKNDGVHNYFINESNGHIVQSLGSRIFIRHKEI